METIFESSHIALDYDESRENRDLGAYRLTTYDLHGNYEESIYISRRQMENLVKGIKDLAVDIEEERNIL